MDIIIQTMLDSSPNRPTSHNCVPINCATVHPAVIIIGLILVFGFFASMLYDSHCENTKNREAKKKYRDELTAKENEIITVIDTFGNTKSVTKKEHKNSLVQTENEDLSCYSHDSIADTSSNSYWSSSNSW